MVTSLAKQTSNPLLASLLAILIGTGFLYYGLTRQPLYFNRFNPWKKPLPVWAARLVYLPMAFVFFYFGLRGLVEGLR
jgi:hypothetical protein